MSVFTAPVLADDDPPYRGILIPRRFWKIAAWSAGPGALATAGFVLDQSDLIDAASVAPLGGFRTFQVPVRDIADLAGVDLGPLVDADVLAAPVTARATGWRELTAPSAIRLQPD